MESSKKRLTMVFPLSTFRVRFSAFDLRHVLASQGFRWLFSRVSLRASSRCFMRAPPSWIISTRSVACQFRSVHDGRLAGAAVGRFCPRGRRGWVGCRCPRSTEDCQAHEAGRPWALSASRAARTVRPE